MKSSNKQPAINVLVSPAGEITVEAGGYSGSTCVEATRFLEEALGLAGNRTRKAEFYRRERTTKNPNQRQQRT